MSAISRLAIPRRKKVFKANLLPDGDKLPFWKTLDLDEKLPVVPSPKGAYTLYTTSIGQPKYQNKQKYDFDLTDPFCHEQPLEYDSLHDPYLKSHFQRKDVKQHLIKNGLMNENDRVICSLKEFNRYRGYIRYRKATELSLQRKREKDDDGEYERRAISERIEREPQSIRSDDTKKENRRHSLCLLDEIRQRETDALIRREQLRREKEERKRKRLIDDWKNRKIRQEQKLKRIDELKNSSRRHKDPGQKQSADMKDKEAVEKDETESEVTE